MSAIPAMLNIARKAARDAGKFIAQSSERIDKTVIEQKGAHDYVTEIDRRSESFIINTIQEAYPTHAILAEESGQSENTESSEYQWVIDPLDGTTNFIHGIPQYAISIALMHNNKIELGLVYDPIKQEEFSAIRGQGAQLNGRRIRVSQIKNMKDALIGTGFPFREDQLAITDMYFEQAKRIAKETAGIRRAGSASLDLAYVAAGRLDAYWEYGLQTWDIAAGILLVQEAGGLVSDPKGGHDFLKQGNLVCANQKLFKTFLQTLNRKD